MNSQFMKTLNPAQLDAVSAEAKTLQILAGPGSGKTRALTSRVAWLVLEEHVDPSKIIVVTFTNKAAREMQKRLESDDLLGRQLSERLTMGTFHAICARLLRQHAGLVRIKNNFTIADTDLSKYTIRKLMKEIEISDYARRSMKPDGFFKEISNAKNKGIDVHQYVELYRNDFKKRDYCAMFIAYEERMQADNLVDFDNLLLYGRELVKRFPHVMKSFSHILVDEFQDTNVVQYDIVKYITGNDKGLTIVGDPDQSIFGWRCAERENFFKMQEDFPGTVVKNLEENYRSTKNILSAASHVINIDKKRIQKTLFTGNHDGVSMSLLRMTSDTLEAQSVANEIKRVVEFSGGLIQYKDVAILVRASYLTRSIEQALNALTVPYAVVGGVKFFERTEVKDILAYVRFFYNPNDTEAFERIVNTPRRGVGEVTLIKMQKLSRRNDWNVIRVLQVVTGSVPSNDEEHITVAAKTKQKLLEFLAIFNDIRTMIKEKAPISEMLEYIIEAIEYKKFLAAQYPNKDGESRWDNVGELVTFAKSAFDPPKATYVEPAVEDPFERVVDGELSDRINSETLANEDRVAAFLEATTLTSDAHERDEAEQGKVTISTMHSAKGLEWPCVFVMGCESGIIPHPRADDEMEECRLLYVAMTRAKAFLYCTHALERQSWGNMNQTSLSTFLSNLPADTFVHTTPDWNTRTRAWVAKVLRQEEPAEEGLKDSPGSKIWANEKKSTGWGGSYGAEDDLDTEWGHKSYTRWTGYRGRKSASSSSRFTSSSNNNNSSSGRATSITSQPYATFTSATTVKEQTLTSASRKRPTAPNSTAKRLKSESDTS